MPPTGLLLLFRHSVQVALVASGSMLCWALGQGFRQRDCPQLRVMSHVGLSVRKGAVMGKQGLLLMLEAVLVLSLSLHTRL